MRLLLKTRNCVMTFTTKNEMPLVHEVSSGYMADSGKRRVRVRTEALVGVSTEGVVVLW